MLRQSRLTDHWPEAHPTRTPTNSLNPAYILPPEVLVSCFSLLPIADLITANNVSRSWGRRIGPSLWRAAFIREANYDCGDLLGVRHTEQLAREWEEALDRAFGRAHERQVAEYGSDYSPESPPSLTGSDFSEYTPEVEAHEANTEWRHLCLTHLRRNTLRSQGNLIVRWSPEVIGHSMRLAGIHSIDNRVLLHEGPIGNQYPAQQEMKTVSLDCHNLKNANDFYFFNWPSALCYKIEKDTNVDNILHRFRRTQATLNGPAVDWVELWVPYEFITKIAPLKKEVGSIPVGAFQASYDREYIPGFSPIAAINIDEVEGTSCKVQAFATADAGGRLRLWIRIGSKTHLLNGHPQQGVESPPSMSMFLFVHQGGKLQIRSSNGGYISFPLPRHDTIGPSAAVFFHFELREVVLTTFLDRKMASGVVKGVKRQKDIPLCRAHRYLPTPFVPGDPAFDKAMKPTTGVLSWLVQSYKYLQDADCLIMVIGGNGHLLLIPSWTNVFSAQQQLPFGQRDAFIRAHSILVHVDFRQTWAEGPQFRTAFRGNWLHFYTATVTMLLDCGKVVTPFIASRESEDDLITASASTPSDNDSKASGVTLPIPEAIVITGTPRDLSIDNCIIEDADSIYELVSVEDPLVEKDFKDARARKPHMPPTFVFYADNGTVSRAVRVITFAKPPPSLFYADGKYTLLR